MRKKTFHIISLGCAKNTVDSDSMAQLLTLAGYEQVSAPNRAHILIVNTCGFIAPAKEESINTLAMLAGVKKNGQVLLAAGCLAERCGSDVTRQVRDVDAILGTRRWMEIVDTVNSLCGVPAAAGKNGHNVPRAAIQGKSAYVKIADGCRRPCAFCAIPLIKGPPVSRPIDEIVAEVCALQDKRLREIILIAQDTTDYGHDLGMKNGLARLLKEMTAAAPEISWIRIMYAYPGYVTDELIEVMSTHQQIVPYLDIPLQHAHPDTLRRMRRPTDVDWSRRTIEKMRKAIPGLTLRTTFIVGYPGETEKEFQTLLDFTKEMSFDRVGAFKFSFEPGTPGESLGDPVPEEIKEERFKRLMAKQQPISLERNQTFIGQRLDVLIEGNGNGVSAGRSYRDAPEIDGLVLVKGDYATGLMVPVRITGAGVYDLNGVADAPEKSSDTSLTGGKNNG